MVLGEGSGPNVCPLGSTGWLLREKMAEEDTFALGRQSARTEVLGLCRMLGHDGNTVEALSELIAVPPLIE